MYLFILGFIQFYVQFSVSCLIKDIFFGEINLIKYNLKDTVNNYKKNFNLNNNNLINMIPYFVILDIIYSISYDYNYINAFFQIFFQIYYSYFMYKMICVFRKQKENNNMICVYNILAYDIKDIYLFYLLPISFLPFFIGLNKLTIDICFHGYLVYFFLKNSNTQVLINYTTQLDTYLYIYEFDRRITNLFYIVQYKCSKIEIVNKLSKLLLTNNVELNTLENVELNNLENVELNTLENKELNNLENVELNTLENVELNTLENVELNNLENVELNTLEKKNI